MRKILFDKYQETTSETMRTHLEKYIREVPCSACHGARLKPEILAVTVGEKNIWEVLRALLPRVPGVLRGPSSFTERPSSSSRAPW